MFCPGMVDGGKSVTGGDQQIRVTGGDQQIRVSVTGGDQQIRVCPYCNFSTVSEERLQAHVLAQHAQTQTNKVPCPLCQERFPTKAHIEEHLVKVS